MPDKAIDLIDEAGSRVRLQHAEVYCFAYLFLIQPDLLSIVGLILCFQLPGEARELDKEVRQIVKEKERSIRNQDFEKVICFNL